MTRGCCRSIGIAAAARPSRVARGPARTLGELGPFGYLPAGTYNERVSLAHFPVFLRRTLRISLLMLHVTWGVTLAGLVFSLGYNSFVLVSAVGCAVVAWVVLPQLRRLHGVKVPA